MTNLGQFRFRKAVSCTCLLLVLCFTSNCGGAELVNKANANGAQHNGNSSKTDAAVHYLDLANPTITQPIEPTEVEGAKFVEVEVTEVVNPGKYPLSFEVRYQTSDKNVLYLGSFGLYPADNPGKFIVATQGKVKGDGVIVLTLIVADKVHPGDTVKVKIKKIRFVKG